MKVNGQPIEGYHFEKSGATITYTLEYEMMEARVAAGIDAQEWDKMPGTPQWVNPDDPTTNKCEIIMWWRASQRIPAVSTDISNRALKRKR